MADVVRQMFPIEIKKIILHYKRQGKSYADITKVLQKDHGFTCSRHGVRKFNLRFNSTGSILRARSGKHGMSKIKPVHRKIIDLWIAQNPEITAREVCNMLKRHFNLSVSVSVVSKVRKQLNWSVKRRAYCALISLDNRSKRLDYAINCLRNLEDFRNVVFVDETTVEMSSTGRFRFYKEYKGMEPVPQKSARPKHAYKVHMWAGISYHGRTDCCLFTGIMDSKIYQEILGKNLLPWAKETHPDGSWRLYQDNDSKHTSKATKKWYQDNGIDGNIMSTPASSPDLNPIENVWSTLKDHLQRHVKPRKKEELIKGIKDWWQTLTSEKCGKYIDHLHKVIPEVVLNRGGPTQY